MWEAFRDKELTKGEKEKITEQFEARRNASVWKNFARLWQAVPAKGVEAARKELGLDERPMVLLATNVLGDSLTLGREVFSQSMEDWLEKTLQYFAGRTDAQLVIRVHPGEVLIHGQSMMDVIKRVLPKLPEHIRVIAPTEKVNTYDLIAAAGRGPGVYNNRWPGNGHERCAGHRCRRHPLPRAAVSRRTRIPG